MKRIKLVAIGTYKVHPILAAVIEEDLDLMQHMIQEIPANSECGKDCNRAIRGFNAMADSVEKAYGTMKGSANAMLETAAKEIADVVGVFIFG